MSKPVTLKTDRLVLRMPVPGDARQITERIAPKPVVWNLGRAPYPYARSDAEEWLEKVPDGWANDTAYVFAISTWQDGMIGCVGLDRHEQDIWEIGYWLGQRWWGQGFVTEAAGAVLDWAEAEKGIRALASGHFVDNPASGRVLRKLGFEPVGETLLYGRARAEKSPALRYTRGADPQLALGLASH